MPKLRGWQPTFIKSARPRFGNSDIVSTSQVAKPSDHWAKYQVLGEFYVIPMKEAGAGMIGLYPRRFSSLIKMENPSVKIFYECNPYHLLVPRGFTAAIESIYKKKSFDLRLAQEIFRSNEIVSFNLEHPDLPGIVFGVAETGIEYGLQSGDVAEFKIPDLPCYYDRRSLANFMRQIAESLVSFELKANNLGLISNDPLTSPYVLCGSRPQVGIPTCFLPGKIKGDKIEFVMVEQEENLSVIAAYPVDYAEVIEKIKPMFKGVEAQITILSDHGLKPNDFESQFGYFVRVEHNGLNFMGFLLCDHPDYSQGQQFSHKIKFTQIGSFSKNIKALALVLLDPFFELLD